MIRLGDNLIVQVAKVDTFKKQVDFRLVEDRKPLVRPAAGRPTQDKVGISTGPAACAALRGLRAEHKHVHPGDIGRQKKLKNGGTLP